MENIKEIHITVPDSVDMAQVVGEADVYLRQLQDSFSARITVRGDCVIVGGDAVEVDSITAIFADFFRRVELGEGITAADVHHAVALSKQPEASPQTLRDDVILSHRGRAIRPKTAGQKRYVDSIRTNSITFGIGPAGTGKTYLAMAMAIAALKRREVGRIVLTRPIVEAGENLGFLPGTLHEKVDPYIRPLYDALFDMMDADRAHALLANGTIEIAPLAFMRGRTLNDGFIILDEAQNTTPEQMKMFLTRLGFGSKMVITGDITQGDLGKAPSGLRQVRPVLSELEGIAFCDFDGKDVVRHSLVAQIIAAYERAAGKVST